MMIRLVGIIILAHFSQISSSPPRECENASNVLGFAVVRFDSATVLHFFAEADSSKQPVQVLRFFNDPAINSLSFRVEGREIYSLLRPEAHKLDYSLFELPVKSERNAWLEVMVDRQTEKTLWVQETQTISFVDWLQKMQKAFAVERKSIETNPLRLKPDGSTDVAKLKERDCFKVEGRRGIGSRSFNRIIVMEP